MSQRFIELAIVQESIGVSALAIDVTGIEVEGAFVGIRGVFIVLDLVIAAAKGELHAWRAVFGWDRLQNVNGALKVALHAVKARKVEDALLGVGVDLFS